MRLPVRPTQPPHPAMLTSARAHGHARPRAHGHARPRAAGRARPRWIDMPGPGRMGAARGLVRASPACRGLGSRDRPAMYRGLSVGATDRPGTDALASEHALGHRDLLRPGGPGSARGVLAAAVGVPGPLGELEPAVEAVAGAGAPVAAGLAGGDGVPVHAAAGVRRVRTGG